jgi:hypothetical protein
MNSLREAFAQLADYRENPRYPLEGLLTFICLAMMCGCNGLREIARWGQIHRWELSERLGFERYQMPKYGTIRRLLMRLDEHAFTAVISEWGEQVLATYGQETALSGIAIDGKTLRGTRTDELPAVVLISALSHELHQVLGQYEVESKTNEIKGVMPLLADLVLEGRVITVDALHTQRTIAETGTSLTNDG